ncbi:hypothetical protein BvCmsKKP049_01398 [Escherichia coli]|nr:hypothetical protein BvCmsKKP049_01398 [Escherichia coli]
MAVCLNNVSRPQTEPYLRLPRVALRPLRSGRPHRACRTCFSFRSLWACRACRTGISLWTLWTCISRQTGLSPLSPVTFRPLRACRTSITCRSPFAGCPDRAGVTALSLITLRPSRTCWPRVPFISFRTGNTTSCCSLFCLCFRFICHIHCRFHRFRGGSLRFIITVRCAA